MNTIVKAHVQADEPVIPALHPDAVQPKWYNVSKEKLEEHLHTGVETPLTPTPTLPHPPKALAPLTAPRLLKTAQDVMEQRAVEYDKPGGERSVAAVVVALNAILGRAALTEAEGWLFMELLKNVRLFSAPGYHADSGLDGIAYSALKAEAKAREVGR